jgi:hypothetical protein
MTPPKESLSRYMKFLKVQHKKIIQEPTYRPEIISEAQKDKCWTSIYG